MTTTPPPKKTLPDLVAVMAALRAPKTGCPWDLEQTFATIAPYTIEEAYEVADAIARKDMPHLKEELGDLLLQVIYHSQLAAEEKAFTLDDVIDGITRKMIRRHPHVFGDEAARTASLAKDFWEKIKAEERAAAGSPRHSAAEAGKAEKPKGVLADVPVGMPALTRAVKLQSKAARVGFDWPDKGPVLAKIREEIAELEEVVGGTDRARIEDEFGDLMFVMANLARHLEIDPEAALRGTNAKFTRRFAHIEAALASKGRTPAQSDLAEMDALWNEAKAAEKA